MLERELVVFDEIMRGLPDWIAWRLEAFVVVANDRALSSPVLDAWWWQQPPVLPRVTRP